MKFRLIVSFIVIVTVFSCNISEAGLHSYTMEADTNFDEEIIGYELFSLSMDGGGRVISSDDVLALRWFDKSRLYQSIGEIDNGFLLNNVSLSDKINEGGIGYGDISIYNNNIYYVFSVKEGENDYLRLLVDFTRDDMKNLTYSTKNIGGEPHLTVFNNFLYIFYTEGTFFDIEEVKYIVYDGTNWSEPKVAVENTFLVSSIYPIIYEDQLYLFYSGFASPDSGRHLYVTSLDGNNWTEPLQLSLPKDNPYLRKVFIDEGYLYCFWSTPTNYQIEGKRFDGVTWSDKQELENVMTTSLSVEKFNNVTYLSYRPSDKGKRNRLIIGEFHDFQITNTTTLQFPIDVLSFSTAVQYDKIWMFYGDGEYIRYITFDGEEFDYAGIVEPDPWIIQAMDAIVRHWWILLLGGITAVLLWTRISKHKREPKKETPFDREMDAEELSEFLSRRKEKG